MAGPPASRQDREARRLLRAAMYASLLCLVLVVPALAGYLLAQALGARQAEAAFSTIVLYLPNLVIALGAVWVAGGLAHLVARLRLRDRRLVAAIQALAMVVGVVIAVFQILGGTLDGLGYLPLAALPLGLALILVRALGLASVRRGGIRRSGTAG